MFKTGATTVIERLTFNGPGRPFVCDMRNSGAWTVYMTERAFLDAMALRWRAARKAAKRLREPQRGFVSADQDGQYPSLPADALRINYHIDFAARRQNLQMAVLNARLLIGYMDALDEQGPALQRLLQRMTPAAERNSVNALRGEYQEWYKLLAFNTYQALDAAGYSRAAKARTSARRVAAGRCGTRRLRRREARCET